jgi:hypothetical protein
LSHGMLQAGSTLARGVVLLEDQKQCCSNEVKMSQAIVGVIGGEGLRLAFLLTILS